MCETNTHIGSQANRTALSWASADGHEALVKLLLQNGADPSIADEVKAWTAFALLICLIYLMSNVLRT